MVFEFICNRRCELCSKEHPVDIRKTEASFYCFTRLMGSHEMESGLARIVNMARQKGIKVKQLNFTREDFEATGYDRDGFDEFVHWGWVFRSKRAGEYHAGPDMLRRMHQRIPDA